MSYIYINFWDNCWGLKYRVFFFRRGYKFEVEEEAKFFLVFFGGEFWFDDFF